MPKKQLLAGKKIAVLVETEYIPNEIKNTNPFLEIWVQK